MPKHSLDKTVGDIIADAIDPTFRKKLNTFMGQELYDLALPLSGYIDSNFFDSNLEFRSTKLNSLLNSNREFRRLAFSSTDQKNVQKFIVKALDNQPRYLELFVKNCPANSTVKANIDKWHASTKLAPAILSTNQVVDKLKKMLGFKEIKESFAAQLAKYIPVDFFEITAKQRCTHLSELYFNENFLDLLMENPQYSGWFLRQSVEDVKSSVSELENRSIRYKALLQSHRTDHYKKELSLIAGIASKSQEAHYFKIAKQLINISAYREEHFSRHLKMILGAESVSQKFIDSVKTYLPTEYFDLSPVARCNILLNSPELIACLNKYVVGKDSLGYKFILGSIDSSEELKIKLKQNPAIGKLLQNAEQWAFNEPTVSGQTDKAQAKAVASATAVPARLGFLSSQPVDSQAPSSAGPTKSLSF